jgi:hypothetical protein
LVYAACLSFLRYTVMRASTAIGGLATARRTANMVRARKAAHRNIVT